MTLVRYLPGGSPGAPAPGETREVSPSEARKLVERGEAERVIVRQEQIERT